MILAPLALLIYSAIVFQVIKCVSKRDELTAPKRQPLPDIVEEKLSWYWDESILN